LRILFVTAAYLPESIGGVELHVATIAAAMRRLGHEVAIFTRGADPAREEFSLERYAHEGVPVFRLDYKFSDCRSFDDVFRNPRIRASFAALLDEWRPDVVHVHHLTCLSTDLADEAKERGARVVMTLHDFWMGCPRGQRMTPELHLCETIEIERCAPCLTKMWSGWFGLGRDGADVPESARHARDLEQLRGYHRWIAGVLSRIDVLVTPSESSRQVFGRQGIPVDKIHVVENGLDHARFTAQERRHARRFRFGFIGSVLPTKGVRTPVEALLQLDRDDCELHVHGAATPWHEVTGYREQLAALAAPLRDRVVFHDRYEPGDVATILASLDALIVPSLWFEAYCLTLREGFLAGVPVIVSDLGAMREAVTDGVTGLLFKPGDAHDLAAKMTRLMDDAELRARLIASEKRVPTADQNARELLALYAGAAAGALR
jgi:glycosyltransferase involved in cell wall biosynthesis